MFLYHNMHFDPYYTYATRGPVRPLHELRHERDDAGARAGAEDERHRDDRVEGGKRVVRKISEIRSGVGGPSRSSAAVCLSMLAEGCRRSAGCTGLCFKVSRGPCLEPRIHGWKGKSLTTRSLRSAAQHSIWSTVVQRLMSLTVAAAETSWPLVDRKQGLLTQLCLALVSALVRWDGVVDFDAGFQTVMDALVPVMVASRRSRPHDAS